MAGLKRSAEAKAAAPAFNKKQKTASFSKSGKDSKSYSKPTAGKREKAEEQSSGADASESSDEEANDKLSAGRPGSQPNGVKKSQYGDDKKFKCTGFP